MIYFMNERTTKFKIIYIIYDILNTYCLKNLSEIYLKNSMILTELLKTIDTHILYTMYDYYHSEKL